MPKIAPYPFTTLHPHLGKLKFDKDYTLTVADLPGLIEGAHVNKGLGHKFLRHVERTKILIFLLDGSLDPTAKRCPLNDFNTLMLELGLYDKEYMHKPILVVLNKSDLNPTNHQANYDIMISNLDRDKQLVCISAKEATGLDKLTGTIKEMSDHIIKYKL